MTTTVRQKEETLEEICRRVDPEWLRDRDYLPAYKFTGRKFIDNRNNVYQDSE